MRSASSSSRRVRCRADVAERGLDVRVAELRQALAGRRPAGTAARLFSTSPPWASRWTLGQRLQQRPLGRRQVAPGFQVVGQAPGLVERPGLERGHELALVDDPVLKREQSEQEMAVGGGGHGEAPGQERRPRHPDRGHRARSRGERRNRKIIA